MLAQVLEEFLVLLHSGFEPGKIGGIHVLVGRKIPGFRHTQRVSVVNDRIQTQTFDVRIELGLRVSVGAWVPRRNAPIPGCGLVAQLSPRTVRIAVSTPHCSSEVRRPARSPSRLTSTAPICSTRTFVSEPWMLISGRKDALLALAEVGAIKTTDLGRRASD